MKAEKANVTIPKDPVLNLTFPYVSLRSGTRMPMQSQSEHR